MAMSDKPILSGAEGRSFGVIFMRRYSFSDSYWKGLSAGLSEGLSGGLSLAAAKVHEALFILCFVWNTKLR